MLSGASSRLPSLATFLLLIQLSNQQGFDLLCQQAFADNTGKPWRSPPPNTRFLYVSQDQQEVIPPWISFQRDNDQSLGSAASEPVEWVTGGGTCSRAFRVCGYKRVQRQDNWLLSPYINVSEAEAVSIDLSFTMTKCIGPFGGNCQLLFDVYTNLTSNVNVTEASFNDTDFGKFTRISGTYDDGLTLNSGEVKLEVKGFPGLYIALRDTGSCTSLSNVIVKSYVCPDDVSGLAQFPLTNSQLKSRVVTGTCVANATSSDIPQMRCEPNGAWDYSSLLMECQCMPGFEAINESCSACRPGFYKSSNMSVLCSACPLKSYSSAPASTFCPCQQGYDRADDEPDSTHCTTYPSKPRNVALSAVNSTAILVTWIPPLSFGGRTDLTYRVEVVMQLGNTKIIETTENRTIVANLQPYTNFLVTVSSVNGISVKHQNFLNSSTSSFQTQTLPDKPGDAPQNVLAVVNGDTVRLYWDPPTKPYGAIERYTIRYFVNGTGDFKIKDVVGGNNGGRMDAIVDVSNGEKYVFQVRAETSAGAGPYSSPFSPEGGDPGEGLNLLVVIVPAVAGAVVLIGAIIVIVICCKRGMCGNGSSMNSNYNVSFASNEAALLPRKGIYVDPTIYASADEAVKTHASKIDPSHVDLQKVIGEGEFGEVYLGLLKGKEGKNQKKQKGKKTKIAVKSLKPGASAKDRDNFLMEASVMGQFFHENVILLIGVVTEGPRMLIVTEFMDNGSLDNYLKDHDNNLELKVQLQMALDVSRGMDYLSSMRFIHRDLATRNVLVDANLECKVADFGLSREAVDENAYDVKTGGKIPLRWTPPEAIDYKKFTTSSDVWSFGVLLWEIMAYGEHPYWDWTNQKVLERVRQGYRLPPPMDCPVEVHRIMLMCWETERTDRPTFGKLSEELQTGRDTLQRSRVYESVDSWLADLQMDRYVNQFEEAGYIDMSQLASLSHEVLKDRIGVSIAGHRNKILKSLQGYKQLLPS
eukprot:m.182126 g.182126  ORF g.182126 m.182126 type:complete len:979 (+) comp39287_c0_seq1:30-2966(+)